MSALPVLTAVTNTEWEAELVAALDGTELGVIVVRRCVDVADLLATAATGTAKAVVLSADLRRLDREVLARLNTSGVAVVGLVEPGDDYAEGRLHQLGVDHVLPANAPPASVASALAVAASAALGKPIGGFADPRAAYSTTGPPPSLPSLPALPANPPGTGHVVAVWGPAGAPGRSTVAVGLADETARLGVPTLLIDADTYGGCVGQMLGLLDEAPGIAAAARLDNQGNLDTAALASLARALSPTLRVLTGITRADRWPELRPESVRGVLQRARSLAPLTIVDCGFCLEDDEELSYDTMAPGRNGATLSTLDSADMVIVVGSGDPVGTQRLVRGIAELTQVAPAAAARARVVVNKLRKGPIGGDPGRQVAAALKRFCGVTHIEALPHDLVGVDKALASGKTLAEAAPDSPLRAALGRLASMLAASIPAPAR